MTKFMEVFEVVPTRSQNIFVFLILFGQILYLGASNGHSNEMSCFNGLHIDLMSPHDQPYNTVVVPDTKCYFVATTKGPLYFQAEATHDLCALHHFKVNDIRFCPNVSSKLVVFSALDQHYTFYVRGDWKFKLFQNQTLNDELYFEESGNKQIVIGSSKDACTPLYEEVQDAEDVIVVSQNSIKVLSNNTAIFECPRINLSHTNLSDLSSSDCASFMTIENKRYCENATFVLHKIASGPEERHVTITRVVSGSADQNYALFDCFVRPENTSCEPPKNVSSRSLNNHEMLPGQEFGFQSSETQLNATCEVDLSSFELKLQKTREIFKNTKCMEELSVSEKQQLRASLFDIVTIANELQRTLSASCDQTLTLGNDTFKPPLGFNVGVGRHQQIEEDPDKAYYSLFQPINSGSFEANLKFLETQDNIVPNLAKKHAFKNSTDLSGFKDINHIIVAPNLRDFLNTLQNEKFVLDRAAYKFQLNALRDSSPIDKDTKQRLQDHLQLLIGLLERIQEFEKIIPANIAYNTALTQDQLNALKNLAATVDHVTTKARDLHKFLKLSASGAYVHENLVIVEGTVSLIRRIHDTFDDLLLSLRISK